MSCCTGCSMFKRRRDAGVNNHPVVSAEQNAAPLRRSTPKQEESIAHHSNNSAQVRPHHTAAVPLRPDPVSSRQGYKDNMVAERKPPFVRDPLTLSVDFMVRYVGMIASAQGLQHSQEDHLDLIQALDQSQMDGQFKFAESDQDFVTLNLSKYGIKILEKIPQDRFQIPPGIRPPQVVRWRHGLVEIIRAVHYEDSLGRQLMAVKLGQEGEELYDCLLFECTHQDSLGRQLMAVKLGQEGEELYDCLLFECTHQPQATQICKCLELLFNAVCQFTPL